MKRLTKIDIGQILLTLLMFSVIVDPTNTLFGIKEISFVLVLLSVIFHKFIVYKDAFVIIGVSFVFLIISSINGHFNGYEFDNITEIGFYKSFLFLFILLLVKNSHYDFIKASFPSVILISIVSICVYVVSIISSILFSYLYEFAYSHDSFIIIGQRIFYGKNILSVFYKTSPILVIFLSYSYCFFWKTYKLKYLLSSLLFFIALIMSGTRANILSALLIIIGIPIWVKIKNKVFIVSCAIFCVIFSALVLFSDKKEESLQLKNEQLVNSIEHIKSNKDIIFLGQGCGSCFYAAKTRPKCSITELSYIELLRMFGLLGALFIIFVFIFPLILMFRRKPLNYIPFAIGYIAYLFIGGTNPLLIGSSGFSVLAIAYSFSFGNSKLELKKV